MILITSLISQTKKTIIINGKHNQIIDYSDPFPDLKDIDDIDDIQTDYLTYEEQTKIDKKIIATLKKWFKEESLRVIQKREQNWIDYLKDKKLTFSDNPSAFLAAIGEQESGSRYNGPASPAGANGKHQWLKETWIRWSKLYSKFYNIPLSEILPFTPANQEKVAYFKASLLYSRYHNWQDVACIWYTGESISEVKRKGYWNQKQKFNMPSPRQYIYIIIAKYKKLLKKTKI